MSLNTTTQENKVKKKETTLNIKDNNSNEDLKRKISSSDNSSSSTTVSNNDKVERDNNKSPNIFSFLGRSPKGIPLNNQINSNNNNNNNQKTTVQVGFELNGLPLTSNNNTINIRKRSHTIDTTSPNLSSLYQTNQINQSNNQAPIPTTPLLIINNNENNNSNQSSSVDNGYLGGGHGGASVGGKTILTPSNRSPNITSNTSSNTMLAPSSYAGSSTTSSSYTPQFIGFSPSIFSPIKQSIVQLGYMDEYYEIDKDAKIVEYQQDLYMAWRNVIIPRSQQLARNELKFIIRRGVPDDKRVMIWKLIMGYEEFKTTLAYDAVKTTLNGDKVPKKFRNIPSFGGVVSPSDHYLTEEGIQIVKRLLSITALNFPDIEYCPVIPDILHMLLVFMSELDAYTMLNLLINQSNDSMYRYLNTSNRDCTLFVLTFDSLVERHIPKLYKHMISLGISSCQVFCEEWFSRLFVSTLPIHTCLRVFDVFLSEGYKVLYRVGLGMLNIHKRVLLKNANTADSFLSTLKQLNSQLSDSSLLMKKSFGIHLKRDQLTNIDAQQHHKLRHVSEPDIPIYYRPKVSSHSNIIDEEHYEMIWAWLPNKFGICDPKIMFRSDVDGFNLRLMYERLGDESPVLILIKSDSNSVFGFFTEDPVQPNDGFGSVSTFVFTIKPHVSVYEPTLKNRLFVQANNSGLSVGRNSVGESALTLDKEFHGTSYPTDTFDNPSLNTSSSSFTSLLVEAYVLR